MDSPVSANAGGPGKQGATLRPESCVALTVDMQRGYLDPAVGVKTMPGDRAAAVPPAP
jgi:hypothetical protein